MVHMGHSDTRYLPVHAPLQVTPLVIDGGLMAICSTVADVKGWSMQEAADRLAANFRAFYAQQVR